MTAKITTLIVTLSSISALEIKHEIVKSCSVLTDKGEIDLSLVAKTDGQSAAYMAFTEPGAPIYYWNPCQDTLIQGYKGCSKGEVFAIDDSDSCDTLSTKDGAQFSVKGDQIFLDYVSNNDDSHIKLVCPTPDQQEGNDPDPGSFRVNDTCDEGNCFTLSSSVCCFKHVAPTTAPHTGLSISAGSILIIIVLALAVIYVVSGVLVMKFVKKSEGAGLCPNFEFWKSLPFLVKDGVKFVFQCCKVTGDGNSYDNI